MLPNPVMQVDVHVAYIGYTCHCYWSGLFVPFYHMQVSAMSVNQGVFFIVTSFHGCTQN